MIFFNVNDDPYDRKLIKVQHMFEPCRKDEKTGGEFTGIPFVF